MSAAPRALSDYFNMLVLTVASLSLLAVFLSLSLSPIPLSRIALTYVFFIFFFFFLTFPLMFRPKNTASALQLERFFFLTKQCGDPSYCSFLFFFFLLAFTFMRTWDDFCKSKTILWIGKFCLQRASADHSDGEQMQKTSKLSLKSLMPPAGRIKEVAQTTKSSRICPH